MARSIMNALMGAAVGLCVLVVPAAAQAPRGNANPFIGTWKVNVERSHYVGIRPPADQVTLYNFAPMPDGSTRFTLVSTNGLGGFGMQVSVFRIDGERYPVHNFNTIGQLMAMGQDTNIMRSYRQIDANTVEFTGYTNGEAGEPTIRQLGPDGNSYVQRLASGEGNILLLERID